MHALTAALALGLPFAIAWYARRREALARALTPIALVALSTTVVMGVAALLFILRAWPLQFTHAVVGLFPAALGILPLLAVAYAALYGWQLRGWRAGPAVAGVAVLGIAAVFASIAAWSNNPDIPCRLVQFVTAAVAVSGVAILVRFAGRDEARLGARIALAGTLLQAGAGAWYLFSIPDLPVGMLLSAPVAAGIGFALVVGALAFGARIPRFSATAAAAGMVFAALSMAALREGARSVSPPRIDATSKGRRYADRLVGLPGMENFARVAPGIYRSAQPTPEAWPALKALGLKTVINLRSHHSDAEEAGKAGIDAVHLELHASVTGSSAPTDDEIRKFFEIVLDPKRQPVLFHCAQGKDRTGTMGALYRIEMDGWSPDEAIEEMRAFGYHVIYRELLNFVRGYKPRGFKRG